VDTRTVVASVVIIVRARTDARSSMEISYRVVMVDAPVGRSAHVRRSAIKPAFEFCVTAITERAKRGTSVAHHAPWR
jgi:hypothetical protein